MKSLILFLEEIFLYQPIVAKYRERLIIHSECLNLKQHLTLKSWHHSLLVQLCMKYRVIKTAAVTKTLGTAAVICVCLLVGSCRCLLGQALSQMDIGTHACSTGILLGCVSLCRPPLKYLRKTCWKSNNAVPRVLDWDWENFCWLTQVGCLVSVFQCPGVCLRCPAAVVSFCSSLLQHLKM